MRGEVTPGGVVMKDEACLVKPAGGLLCAGLDVEAGCEEDFLAWHSREHLIERLDVPGFLTGRRFFRTGQSPQYLILYEVEDLSVLSSPAYLERLNNPTPWTLRATKTLRNGFRDAHRVVWFGGAAEGGFVLALRFSPTDAPKALANIDERARDELLSGIGVTRAWFALPDRNTSTIATAESRRSGNVFTDSWLLMVEGISREALDQVVASALSAQRFGAWGIEKPPAADIYQLQLRIGRRSIDSQKPRA